MFPPSLLNPTPSTLTDHQRGIFFLNAETSLLYLLYDHITGQSIKEKGFSFSLLQMPSSH